jgi:AraC family transcriptional regulator of adaptative response / DNA-3-methyladenine glycosylase II
VDELAPGDTGQVLPDDETCYRAVQGRDPRFDGWFFTAVRTTGIYCRPSCPARTPLRRNVTFQPSAAAAQRAGYRACKRCRPDASPGSPEWDARGDLAGRALRLIADGVVDRDGVPGLARRLGYSERQVNRTLLAEVGAGPIALARAQRAQTARVLLERTELPAADVAFSAGFASVRQFNDTIQAVFATTPTALRCARRATGVSEPGTITVRLPYRAPMDLSQTLDYLARRAIPGVETFADGVYSRVLDAPHGPALISLSAHDAHDGAAPARIRLADQRDLVAVVARLRRLLDLDADPQAVDAVLSDDPALQPLIVKRPGLRAAGAVDGFELALRAIIGQQISVAGARTLLGRLAAEYGQPAFGGEPWRLFPRPDVLAGLNPVALPMPRARGATLIALAAAVADGELTLDPGADRAATRAALLSLPGIGPWTADYLRMRALADPDVLLSTDLGIARSATALGVSLAGGRPDWSPWRSYVSHHLWAALH